MYKAILFSAGLGTRLRPITNSKPKALVDINETPLIEYALRHLIYYNVKDIIVNVHHFAEDVKNTCNFLSKKYKVNISISDETSLLLETGGALKKVQYFFNDVPYFIAYNVDILSNLNLSELIRHYEQNDALATLSVRSRKTSRYFLFNEKMELCGWKNMQNNEIKIRCTKIQRLRPFAFSGIQIISTDIFSLLKPFGDVFSITEAYINLCAFYRILGLYDATSFWMDIGTVDKLEEAKKNIDKLIY